MLKMCDIVLDGTLNKKGKHCVNKHPKLESIALNPFSNTLMTLKMGQDIQNQYESVKLSGVSR